MNRRRSILAALLVAAPLLLIPLGCTSVVKQNIISSVQTGLGITLCENPQTQFYEAKVGYIRSQFYSIPTGKIVGKIEGVKSERADITPEVVSGIRVSSGIQHLFLGADIAENFAVGKEAVNSRAAVAMYISGAGDPASARAASLGIRSVPIRFDPSTIEKAAQLETLLDQKLPAGYTYNKIKFSSTENLADYIARGITSGMHGADDLKMTGGSDLNKLVEKLGNALSKANDSSR